MQLSGPELVQIFNELEASSPKKLGKSRFLDQKKKHAHHRSISANHFV